MPATALPSSLRRAGQVAFALLWASTAFGQTVVTTFGAPLKVVVRKDCAIFELPDRSSTSQSASAFDFFYVLPPVKKDELKVDPEKPDAALKNGFFRISTSDKDNSMIGWIAQEDVVVWPHRQAVQMRPIAGRKRANFYKTDKELKSAYTGAATPDPFSREPEVGAGTSLMPLLAEFRIKTPAGDEVNGYHVAYLHELAVGKGGAPAGPKVNLKASSLDVVFVIDTTKSMQPYIDATKDVIRELAKGLDSTRSEDAPVRFGLVAYRDRIDTKDSNWYVTKTFWDLNRSGAVSATDAPPKGTDISEFLEALTSVTAATVGSEDTPEDVLGGLREAVRMPGWNPNGYKHVILIGDASGHVDAADPKNPERLTIDGIKAMMQPSSRESLNAKMICHTVRVVGEDPEDYAFCEDQYTKLAEGVDYPGMFEKIEKGKKAEFVGKLVDLINNSRKDLKSAVGGGLAMAPPAAPPAPGAAPTPPAPAPPLARGFGLLLEMVAAAKAGDGAVPTFASGYVASTDVDGKEQVEPYLLVQYGQIQTFQSLLNLSINAVRSAGEPGGRDVEKIISTLQIACTQLSINEPIKPDVPLRVFFTLVLGFPVRSEIFDVTPAKLASMTQEDFDQWTKKMEGCDSILKGYIENPQLWKALGRETKPDFRQGFLKISELP